MFYEQPIGIYDANHVEIKEGDKLIVLHTDWPSKSDSDKRSLDEYLDSISFNGFVRYFSDMQRFALANKDGDYICNLNVGRHGRIKRVIL